MTHDVGNWLLALVRNLGATNESDILRLNVSVNDAIVWIIARTLHFSWTKRVLSKKADYEECISHLRAEVAIMKNTHHSGLSGEISSFLS